MNCLDKWIFNSIKIDISSETPCYMPLSILAESIYTNDYGTFLHRLYAHKDTHKHYNYNRLLKRI
jgi:hypothetical protein